MIALRIFNRISLNHTNIGKILKIGIKSADQHVHFRYIDSTIPLLPKSENFKPLTIFCGCTARYSGPGRKPHKKVSHDATHILTPRRRDKVHI